MNRTIVADTNILVAALLSEGPTRRIIFSKVFDIRVPAFILEEIQEHRAEFLAKSGLDEGEFEQARSLLFTNVIVEEKQQYMDFTEEAKTLCKDPDDWPFFALALARDCPIWTHDKGFRNQTAVKIYSTSDLLKK